MTKRREFLMAAGVLGAFCPLHKLLSKQGADVMYGMIAKITSAPNQRAELIRILSGGTSSMPGCISYVIAEDAVDGDAVWVTEIWDNKASHDASVLMPSVKDVIAKAKPLIAGFTKIAEITPVAGVHGSAPQAR